MYLIGYESRPVRVCVKTRALTDAAGRAFENAVVNQPRASARGSSADSYGRGECGLSRRRGELDQTVAVVDG